MEEVLVVDPLAHTVELLLCEGSGWGPAAASPRLGVGVGVGRVCRPCAGRRLSRVWVADQDHAAAFLARRRASGQDRHDEVWKGGYHVAPYAHSDHGIVELQVGAMLLRRAMG